jgi:hypothetical protein
LCCWPSRWLRSGCRAQRDYPESSGGEERG